MSSSKNFSDWSREEKDAFAKRRMQEMKEKNEKLMQRYAEVLKDQHIAENQNSSITSSVKSGIKKEKSENTELPAENKIQYEREWDRGKTEPEFWDKEYQAHDKGFSISKNPKGFRFRGRNSSWGNERKGDDWRTKRRDDDWRNVKRDNWNNDKRDDDNWKRDTREDDNWKHDTREDDNWKHDTREDDNWKHDKKGDNNWKNGKRDVDWRNFKRNNDWRKEKRDDDWGNERDEWRSKKDDGWKNEKRDDGWKSEKRDDGWKSEKRDDGWKSEKRDDGWKSEKRDDGWKSEKRDDGWKSEKRDDGWKSEKRDDGWKSEKRDDGWKSEKREDGWKSEKRDDGWKSEKRDDGWKSEKRGIDWRKKRDANWKNENRDSDWVIEKDDSWRNSTYPHAGSNQGKNDNLSSRRFGSNYKNIGHDSKNDRSFKGSYGAQGTFNTPTNCEQKKYNYDNNRGFRRNRNHGQGSFMDKKLARSKQEDAGMLHNLAINEQKESNNERENENKWHKAHSSSSFSDPEAQAFDACKVPETSAAWPEDKKEELFLDAQYSHSRVSNWVNSLDDPNACIPDVPSASNDRYKEHEDLNLQQKNLYVFKPCMSSEFNRINREFARSSNARESKGSYSKQNKDNFGYRRQDGFGKKVGPNKRHVGRNSRSDLQQESKHPFQHVKLHSDYAEESVRKTSDSDKFDREKNLSFKSKQSHDAWDDVEINDSKNDENWLDHPTSPVSDNKKGSNFDENNQREWCSNKYGNRMKSNEKVKNWSEPSSNSTQKVYKPKYLKHAGSHEHSQEKVASYKPRENKTDDGWGDDEIKSSGLKNKNSNKVTDGWDDVEVKYSGSNENWLDSKLNWSESSGKHNQETHVSYASKKASINDGWDNTKIECSDFNNSTSGNEEIKINDNWNHIDQTDFFRDVCDQVTVVYDNEIVVDNESQIVDGNHNELTKNVENNSGNEDDNSEFWNKNEVKHSNSDSFVISTLKNETTNMRISVSEEALDHNAGVMVQKNNVYDEIEKNQSLKSEVIMLLKQENAKVNETSQLKCLQNSSTNGVKMTECEKSKSPGVNLVMSMGEANENFESKGNILNAEHDENFKDNQCKDKSLNDHDKNVLESEDDDSSAIQKNCSFASDNTAFSTAIPDIIPTIEQTTECGFNLNESMLVKNLIDAAKSNPITKSDALSPLSHIDMISQDEIFDKNTVGPEESQQQLPSKSAIMESFPVSCSENSETPDFLPIFDTGFVVESDPCHFTSAESQSNMSSSQNNSVNLEVSNNKCCLDPCTQSTVIPSPLQSREQLQYDYDNACALSQSDDGGWSTVSEEAVSYAESNDDQIQITEKH